MGVERSDPHSRCRFFTQKNAQAVAHFVGGALGKRGNQDARGRHALGNQARDAAEQNRRFTRTRPGKHERSPVRVIEGFALGRIEAARQCFRIRQGGGFGCGRGGW